MSWKVEFKKNLEDVLINFDPSQPRDEKGRWTSGSREDSYSNKKKRLYKNVEKFEDSIRAKVKENCGFFDEKGGLLLKKEGEMNRINFSVEEMMGVKGKVEVMTHNHPKQTSFSPEDVFFAIKMGIGEMRVVSSNFTYIIKSPDNWRSVAPGTDGLRKFVNRLNEIDNKVFWQQMSLIENGQIGKADATLVHTHNIWKDLSKEYNFTYVRKVNSSTGI